MAAGTDTLFLNALWQVAPFLLCCPPLFGKFILQVTKSKFAGGYLRQRGYHAHPPAGKYLMTVVCFLYGTPELILPCLFLQAR